MSNKNVVQNYMDGFNAGDHVMILSCLTEDVTWDVPGFFHIEGKEAFDKEIENDAFEGLPVIHIVRMVEEGDIVVAEGGVKSKFRNGGMLDAVFCDVFHFEKGKIKKLTSYLMDTKK